MGEAQPSLVIMRHLEFTDDTSRDSLCIPLTTRKLMNIHYNNTAFGCKFIYDREHRAMIIVFCPPLFCLSTLLSKDFLSSGINVAHSSIYQSCSAAEQRGQLGDFCQCFSVFPRFFDYNHYIELERYCMIYPPQKVSSCKNTEIQSILTIGVLPR